VPSTRFGQKLHNCCIHAYNIIELFNKKWYSLKIIRIFFIKMSHNLPILLFTSKVASNTVIFPVGLHLPQMLNFPINYFSNQFSWFSIIGYEMFLNKCFQWKSNKRRQCGVKGVKIHLQTSRKSIFVLSDSLFLSHNLHWLWKWEEKFLSLSMLIKHELKLQKKVKITRLKHQEKFLIIILTLKFVQFLKNIKVLQRFRNCKIDNFSSVEVYIELYKI